MNNYVIDPQVFYWIYVLNGVQFTCVIGALITGVICGVTIWFYVDCYSKLDEPCELDECDRENEYWIKRHQSEIKEYNEGLQDLRTARKHIIISFVVFIVFILCAIFIPTKRTSVEMLIAKTATFDNIDWTVQQVKEVVDYIVNALKGI